MPIAVDSPPTAPPSQLRTAPDSDLGKKPLPVEAVVSSPVPGINHLPAARIYFFVQRFNLI